MIQEIRCQACKPEDSGCLTCGGYKYILAEIEACLGCKRKGWVRPGVSSLYEGKEVWTFDGLKRTYTKGKPLCDECLNAKERP